LDFDGYDLCLAAAPALPNISKYALPTVRCQALFSCKWKKGIAQNSVLYFNFLQASLEKSMACC
jgi:hypothetical protein